MSQCPECGNCDWDWWTETGQRVLLCEVCGYTERHEIEDDETDDSPAEEAA